MNRKTVGARAVSLRGHTFIDFARDSRPTILDCGAHRGEFANEAVRRWGSKVYAIEASRELIDRMSLLDGATKHHFAVASVDGEVRFAHNENQEASHIVEAEDRQVGVAVPAISLSTFVRRYEVEEVDLLKLDIEGAECGVLMTTPDDVLSRIKQISVEFHDFCEYVTSSEVNQAVQRLKKLGFRMFKFSRTTNGDILFVNKTHIPMSRDQILRLRYFEYYRLGIERVISPPQQSIDI